MSEPNEPKKNGGALHVPLKCCSVNQSLLQLAYKKDRSLNPNKPINAGNDRRVIDTASNLHT